MTENTKRGKVYFTENNMLYLSAIADKCGYEIKINTNNTFEKTLNEIKEFAPNFIVAQIRFQVYKPQIGALAKIKEIFPQIKIIVTGEPFLTYNNNVTYENPFISYVIYGEPEHTFKEILDGVPDNEILGICYTDENMQAIKNEPRPLIDNLDELPFPIRKSNKESIEFIEVSRGCPHHCFFCMATPLRGSKIRCRSVSNIIEEIKYCIDKYNVSSFVFKADNFNENKDWCIELCKQIIENKLKIQWSVNILPKNIDDDLAKLMKKSGCVLCNIGIESGDTNILNNIEKKISLEDIKSTVKILKKNRIAINNCFIFGLPWETEESIEETMKVANKLDSDEASFYIASPFPGTKFFIYSMLNKLVTEEINFSNAIRSAVVRTHKLSKEDINKLYLKAVKNFYIRPKYILKCIFTLNFGILLKIAKIYFTGFKKFK